MASLTVSLCDIKARRNESELFLVLCVGECVGETMEKLGNLAQNVGHVRNDRQIY